MKFSINGIISYYMRICLALMGFNILYIARSKHTSRARSSRQQQWTTTIAAECACIQNGSPPADRYSEQLVHKLRHIENLMAYHEAVLSVREQDPDAVQQYLDAYSPVFYQLAVLYRDRPAMERAFLAHVIAVCHPACGHLTGRLIETLLTYFEDSTVFCRENILHALFALGDGSAVKRAFHLMNRHGWFHDSRLLADGLAAFNGDRTELAWQLWEECHQWSESFQVAVVRFAGLLSDSFCAEFLAALQRESTRTEVRFALVRYFQRRPYPAAYPYLLHLLARDQQETGGLAIAAASALVSYPGQETHDALFEALHSRNWYVRKNAAASLTALGDCQEDLVLLRQQGDRYAAEMLEYMIEAAQARHPQTGETPQILEVGA